MSHGLGFRFVSRGGKISNDSSGGYIKIMNVAQTNTATSRAITKKMERLLNEENKKPIPRPAVLKVSDIPRSINYVAGSKIRKPTHHNGQRKLALTEVQFLTKSISKYPNVTTCLYVGSAPSNKTHMLSQLFPTIKFVLVDPNQFKIAVPNESGKLVSHRKTQHPDIIHMNSTYKNESISWQNKKGITRLTDMDPETIKSLVDFTMHDTKYKIYVIEAFFTNKLADLFKNTNVPLFFISDIRSNINEGSGPQDIDIVWNSSMMFNWMMRMKPAMSMIKFRIPFMGDTTVQDQSGDFASDFAESKKHGIDFLGDRAQKKFIFSTGELYIQAWAPKSSTELRIHIDAGDIEIPKLYDPKEVDNAMFYYNLIERPYMSHYNPNASRKFHFCTCNDCAIENDIWSDYKEKIDPHNRNVLEHVISMGKITGRPLRRMHQSTIYGKITQRRINEIIQDIKDPVNVIIQKRQTGNRGRPSH